MMLVLTPEEMRRFVVEYQGSKLCRVYDTVNRIHGPWCNAFAAQEWWDRTETAIAMKKGTYGQPEEK